jgi:L-histidine Nalpha-methyltransferase
MRDIGLGGIDHEEHAAGVAEAPSLVDVAEAVRAGLAQTPKRLPPWLLYDARGSALFEEITRLPEYYLTRTERTILGRHAAEIVDASGPPLEAVELGAGSAVKTALVLEALLARQGRATYVPIDVSPAALRAAAAGLARLPGLTVRPLVARYPEDLDRLGPSTAPRRLVLFLGSNVGNYDPRAAHALLVAVRARLEAGDAFVLGADLRKPASLLVPAYDDARGVTAAFTKNLLVRINRELGADFDVDRFRHVALWNDPASRMDLYLESSSSQRVRISALRTTVSFARGESIHIESSYKFTDATVDALLVSAGFRPEVIWHDRRRWFGLTLARVA